MRDSKRHYPEFSAVTDSEDTEHDERDFTLPRSGGLRSFSRFALGLGVAVPVVATGLTVLGVALLYWKLPLPNKAGFGYLWDVWLCFFLSVTLAAVGLTSAVVSFFGYGSKASGLSVTGGVLGVLGNLLVVAVTFGAAILCLLLWTTSGLPKC